ncbi:MFS transporter [Alloiococcus sp. CFN-8]|uniref:MFS transporter n=1 Tax=Alloiococcus sp. CFN-8 TaxID=3416081 RepID=UPI003CFB0D80
MVTILLIITYIAAISLGIPDSLLGAAWPAIYRQFGVSVSSVSFITIVISAGTVTSSFLSGKVINKFGTGMVTAMSTSFTAIALLGFSLSNSLIWLCLFAVPLGIGAGSIDSALNNYVALRYKATHMSFLHCFYGIGVSLSPYLMSLALSEDLNWRRGYRTVFFIQLTIAIITILALPLWNKVQAITKEEDKPRDIKFIELFKMATVRAQYGIFIGSCAIEAICLVWGSTFLVNAKGVPEDEAAGLITVYFVGMAIGRFLSGVLANKFSCWELIKSGQIITAVAIIILLLPLPVVYSAIGLFMVGLGNGAVFPNVTHMTPDNFGRDISQAVIGTQMAFAYLSIMLAPPFFGLLVETFSIKLFPVFLLAMFFIMIGSTYFLKARLKREEKIVY